MIYFKTIPSFHRNLSLNKMKIKQSFKHLALKEKIGMIAPVYIKLLASIALGFALLFALIYHFLDLEDAEE